MTEHTKNSQQPKIAAKTPEVMELKLGEYWWCSCGKSSKQPFCDGSHQETSFLPQKVEIKEDSTVALCNCKHSQNGAFCDGSHTAL